MKLLLDTRIWGRAREELEVAGHDVVWTGDWIEDPGDEEILSHAYRALGVYGEELLAGAIANAPTECRCVARVSCDACVGGKLIVD